MEEVTPEIKALVESFTSALEDLRAELCSINEQLRDIREEFSALYD